mmetsp:Transcript_1398/g.3259  ORF Transcript_1398/g.3259 Transcript_1398/m.3259 type:complete len:484 (-) Transcript_1398:956-2407(-)
MGKLTFLSFGRSGHTLRRYSVSTASPWLAPGNSLRTAITFISSFPWGPGPVMMNSWFRPPPANFLMSSELIGWDRNEPPEPLFDAPFVLLWKIRSSVSCGNTSLISCEKSVKSLRRGRFIATFDTLSMICWSTVSIRPTFWLFIQPSSVFRFAPLAEFGGICKPPAPAPPSNGKEPSIPPAPVETRPTPVPTPLRPGADKLKPPGPGIASPRPPGISKNGLLKSTSTSRFEEPTDSWPWAGGCPPDEEPTLLVCTGKIVCSILSCSLLSRRRSRSRSRSLDDVAAAAPPGWSWWKGIVTSIVYRSCGPGPVLTLCACDGNLVCSTGEKTTTGSGLSLLGFGSCGGISNSCIASCSWSGCTLKLCSGGSGNLSRYPPNSSGSASSRGRVLAAASPSSRGCCRFAFAAASRGGPKLYSGACTFAAFDAEAPPPMLNPPPTLPPMPPPPPDIRLCPLPIEDVDAVLALLPPPTAICLWCFCRRPPP